MPKLLKIARFAFITLSFIYALGYLFFLVRGKQIIVRKLQQYSSAHAQINAVVLRFPFTFEVKGLAVPGQLAAKSLRLRPSLLGLLTNKILLYDITFIEPVFVYNRATAKSEGVLRGISEKSRGRPGVPKLNPADFFFRKLSIVNGTLTFIDPDMNKDSGGVTITCDRLNLELDNAYEFPDSIITRFKLRARVPWEKSQTQGSIVAQGWADVYRKDMQATLAIKDIDGVYLQPYFSSWIDLGKTGIEKAKLNFSSTITGLNNEITAVSHFELTEVQFKQKAPEEGQSRGEKITQVVLGILQEIDKGNIVLNFTLKTKMDDPEFGLEPVRSAFEEKIALARRNRGLNAESIILFPGRVVSGTVQSMAVASKSLFDSLFGIGKDVGSSFSKEKSAK